MFYSEVVLTKRGPLARVWLAAHWERKLSKSQYLQADVAKSVEAMLGHGTAPMALRLSGQLLLGIVRIYSRKAKYLLDDCNDTLVKIKMAFRTGGVDLTSDQLVAPKHTITLQPNRTEFDLLLPDRLWQAWNVDPYLPKSLQGGSALDPTRARSRSRSATPARALSLRPSERAYAQGGFGVFAENQSDFGLDSQDYYDNSAALDLGMDEDIAAAERSRATNRRSLPSAPRQRGISTGLGLGAPDRPRVGSVDDSLSIGVGRDAAADAGMASFGSMLGGDFREGNFDFGFEDQPDLGLSFGGDDMPDLDLGFGQDLQLAPLPAGPPHDGSSVRASTPEPVEDSFQKALANVTPRTAAKIREAAERRQQAQGAAGTKSRRQIVDRFTELADSNAVQNQLIRWTQDRYVPSSRIDLELMSVRKDPASHLFPWFDPNSKDKTSVCFASSDLAPELMDLFTVDLTAIRRKRSASPGPSAGGSEADRSAKRLRAHASDDGDLESEVGRRADPLQELSFAPFGDDHGGLDFGVGADNDAGFDYSLGQDDHVGLDNFGLGPLDPNDDTAELDQDGEEAGGALRRSMRKGGQAGGSAEEGEGNRLPLGRLSTLTRLSTPELGEGEFRESSPSPDNPLAAFAARPSDAQGESQGQQAQGSSLYIKSGLSRNTVRAVKVLQSQLQRDEEAHDDLEGADESASKKTMSFEAVSTKATRRAAAGFFFELLVLATKDCVKVKQEESYGDVEVEAKDKLWELVV